MRIATDIARAARSRADVMERLLHRLGDLGMLTHCEIVVRTPYGDRLWSVMPAKAARIGIGALVAKDIDEHAIAPFGVEPVDRLGKYVRVVHLLAHLNLWVAVGRAISPDCSDFQ